MVMMFRAFAAACAAAILLAVPLSAHEGHDHGGESNQAPARSAPRASSTSDTLELVAIARGGVLAIFIDRFGTNEPVTEAEVSAQAPDGESRLEARRDGSYLLPAPWSTRPGDHEVVLSVTLDAQTELFPLEIHIPEPEPTSTAAGEPVLVAFRAGLAGLDPILSSLAGFAAGAAVALVATRRRRLRNAVAAAGVALALLAGGLSRAVAHEGHVHDEPRAGGPARPAASAQTFRDQAQRLPEGAVFVPKPTQRILALRTIVPSIARHRGAVELPGRIIPDPNGSGMVQTAIGGRLSPPPGGFPRLGTRVRAGDLLAYVTPPIQAIDVSDMRQRQGELDQQISIVERRLTRLEPLARSGAVTQAQLDEAQLELQGLRDRRAALDRSRQESEALRAPVDGVIAEANAIAGQMAQTSAIVFQIVDPTKLWVEALSFETLPGVAEASGRLPSGQILRLTFRGAGLADRSQAVPVHFAVEGDLGNLRVGQFVTVVASRESAKDGMALPRSSIVRTSNGQQVVYAHTAPERFEPREVRVEPLDGERVLVASGLDPGSRVVTAGAELLDQVR